MANMQRLVDEQARAMGRSSVPAVPRPSGSAATDGDKIMYNPAFMARVEASSGEGGVRFVLAHELGHIAGGMVGGHGGELDADRFAARSLAVAGIGRKAITGVMGHLNPGDTPTHPGAGTRSGNAMNAWSSARVATRQATKDLGETEQRVHRDRTPRRARPDRNRRRPDLAL